MTRLAQLHKIFSFSSIFFSFNFGPLHTVLTSTIFTQGRPTPYSSHPHVKSLIARLITNPSRAFITNIFSYTRFIRAWFGTITIFSAISAIEQRANFFKRSSTVQTISFNSFLFPRIKETLSTTELISIIFGMKKFIASLTDWMIHLTYHNIAGGVITIA